MRRPTVVDIRGLVLVQVGAVVALALLLGGICRRFGQPALLGQILAGVLLGQGLFVSGGSPEHDAQGAAMDSITLISGVLLLASTGGAIRFATLRQSRSQLLTVSALGLIVPAAVGAGVGFVPLFQEANGSTTGGAGVLPLVLAAAFAVSSIPVVARILADFDLLARPQGQFVLSASILDDLVGWLLLSAVVAMANAGDRSAQPVLWAAGRFIVLLLGSALCAAVVGWLFRRRTHPIPIAGLIAIALALAGLASVLGVPPEFGALLGGMVASAGGRRPIADHGSLDRLCDVLFAPLFFAGVGSQLDLRSLMTPTTLVGGLLLLAAAMVSKGVAVYCGARLSGSRHPDATFYAGALSARGAVQVLLATVAHRNGFISDGILIMLVGVAVTSVICAVPVVRWAGPRLSDADVGPPRAEGGGSLAQQLAASSTLAVDQPRHD